LRPVDNFIRRNYNQEAMRILIKATALELTPAFKVYAERKLGTVGKLLRPFEKEGEAELRVEIARSTRHHRKGPVFMAEANLRLPGKILRAAENHSDPRAAVDKVENKLKLEVEKYKTQKIERPRRGK
jgi:ribosomal subunit interface protein